MLDAEVCVANSHQRDRRGRIYLKVVVPQIAEQVFSLLLHCVLCRFRDEGIGVCRLGDMLRDIDVYHSEIVADGPFYIGTETVVLWI